MSLCRRSAASSVFGAASIGCVLLWTWLAPSPAPAARQNGAPIRFVDVAPRSHIAYKSNNNFTGRKYFPQPMCGGVAIFD